MSNKNMVLLRYWSHFDFFSLARGRPALGSLLGPWRFGLRHRIRSSIWLRCRRTISWPSLFGIVWRTVFLTSIRVWPDHFRLDQRTPSTFLWEAMRVPRVRCRGWGISTRFRPYELVVSRRGRGSLAAAVMVLIGWEAVLLRQLERLCFDNVVVGRARSSELGLLLGRSSLPVTGTEHRRWFFYCPIPGVCRRVSRHRSLTMLSSRCGWCAFSSPVGRPGGNRGNRGLRKGLSITHPFTHHTHLTVVIIKMLCIS